MAVVAGGGNNQNVNLQINLDNNTQAGLDQAIDGLNDVEQASQETQDGLDGATSALDSFASIPLAGVVAGLVSAGAAVGLLVKAFGDFKASSEIIAVTNAQIKRMGFESDISREQIDRLIGSTRNLDAAREAILGLVSSPGLDPKLLTDLFKLSKTASQIEQIDFGGTATDVGKALTLPFSELEALQGKLLIFTEAQLEAVREMDRVNDTASAQALIIQALRDKYGDIAVQDPGAIFDRIGVNVTLASEKIGALIGDALTPLATIINDLVADFNSFLIITRENEIQIDTRAAREAMGDLRGELVDLRAELSTASGTGGIKIRAEIKLLEEQLEVQRKIVRAGDAEIKSPKKKPSEKFVPISIDLPVFNQQLDEIQTRLKAFRSDSLVLFTEDEQLERKAQSEIDSARKVVNEIIAAQRQVTLAIGTQGRKLTIIEKDEVDARDKIRRASFDALAALNESDLKNTIRLKENSTQLELDFSDALLAIHKKLEDDKTSLTDEAEKKRLKILRDSAALQLKNSEQNRKAIEKSIATEDASLDALSTARAALTKLGESARPEKTDAQKIVANRNIALEKSIELINAESLATGMGNDALLKKAENYRLLDEAGLNEARLTAQGDELLVIEAQIAATQQLSAAQQFSFELMTSALESQKTLWSDLANSGINVFSNALAAAFVRQRKAIDIIKSGLASIGQQFVATLIKIGIQRVISTAIGQGVEKTATISAIASSRLRTIAYAKEAAAFSLASAGFSAGAGVTALIAAVPASLAAVAPLVGIAHGGIDRVPTTGTFLLEKGEMVSKRQTVDKLDKLLSTGNSPTSRRPLVNDISVNLSLNISALDGQSVVEILDKAEGQVKSMAVEGLMQFFEQRGITLNG